MRYAIRSSDSAKHAQLLSDRTCDIAIKYKLIDDGNEEGQEVSAHKFAYSGVSARYQSAIGEMPNRVQVDHSRCLGAHTVDRARNSYCKVPMRLRS
jgi:cation transport regulator ChaB